MAQVRPRTSVNVSANGFADFFDSGSDLRRRAVLKRFKRPGSGESKGRSNYYVSALSGIRRFVASDSQMAALDAAISDLRLRPTETKLERTKVDANLRCLDQFRKHFGDLALSKTNGSRFYFVHHDLTVSCQPDLVAMEHGALKLFKLNFTAIPRSSEYIRAASSVVYAAAKESRDQLIPSQVAYLDLASGIRHNLSADRLLDDEALGQSCEQISQLWMTL
jgi:hypothetical protein